ncbi:protein LST8 [Pelomyxa schiedti]|nr:protein LST8 [Pelomyxa schiedti]
MPSTSVVLATASYDSLIRFWEAPTGMCLRQISFAESQVNRMAISPDKLWLAAAGNPHVRIFDIANAKSTAPVSSYDGHKGNVTAVGYRRDGQWLYSGSEDGTIQIWDMRSGRIANYHVPVPAPVNSVALHPDQLHVYCVDQDGRLQVWDLMAAKCMTEIVVDKESAARAVSVSNDGEYCAVSTSKGECHVFALERAPSHAATPTTTATTSTTATASTSTSAAAPPDHSKRSGEFPMLVTTIKAHDSHILQTLFSPDSQYLATTSADRNVKLWAVNREFQQHKNLQGHQRWVWDCAFSADSAYLITGSSDASARLWDLSNGETLKQYSCGNKAVSCVALNDCN